MNNSRDGEVAVTSCGWASFIALTVCLEGVWCSLILLLVLLKAIYLRKRMSREKCRKIHLLLSPTLMDLVCIGGATLAQHACGLFILSCLEGLPYRESFSMELM